MKSLKTIQVLAKIGRVLSTIMFVMSIVGFCICLVGIAGLAMGMEAFKMGDVTFKTLIQNNAKLSPASLYCFMSVGAVACAGEAVLSKFAEVYFKRELADGTPFTLRGANELLRLGILGIAIPLGTQIINSIIIAVSKASFGSVKPLDFSDFGGVSLGITFIIISVILKSAVEFLTKNEDKATDAQ